MLGEVKERNSISKAGELKGFNTEPAAIVQNVVVVCVIETESTSPEAVVITPPPISPRLKICDPLSEFVVVKLEHFPWVDVSNIVHR